MRNPKPAYRFLLASVLAAAFVLSAVLPAMAVAPGKAVLASVTKLKSYTVKDLYANKKDQPDVAFIALKHMSFAVNDDRSSTKVFYTPTTTRATFNFTELVDATPFHVFGVAYESNTAIYHDGKLLGNIRALYGSKTFSGFLAHLNDPKDYKNVPEHSCVVHMSTYTVKWKLYTAKGKYVGTKTTHPGAVATRVDYTSN